MEEQKNQGVGNHSLEYEFVPYKEALALKELGFDEPCLGFYTEVYKELIKNFCEYPINLPTKPFLAPLYQQAFRWFRKKYALYPTLERVITTSNIHFRYYFTVKDKEYIKYFNTYEETELACLKKLIEIVKEKQKKSRYETL